MFCFPKLGNYKDYPDFDKHRQSVRGNCLLLSQHLCGARKIWYACFCRLGKINFSFGYIYSQMKLCFGILGTFFCSVGISYLYFLHINANATKKLLSISCDLEAMDQEVEHSLIRTFPLLNQIVWFIGRLLHEKNSRYLELLPQFELFSRYRDSSSYRQSTADLFWRIRSQSNS